MKKKTKSIQYIINIVSVPTAWGWFAKTRFTERVRSTESVIQNIPADRSFGICSSENDFIIVKTISCLLGPSFQLLTENGCSSQHRHSKSPRPIFLVDFLEFCSGSDHLLTLFYRFPTANGILTCATMHTEVCPTTQRPGGGGNPCHFWWDSNPQQPRRSLIPWPQASSTGL